MGLGGAIVGGIIGSIFGGVGGAVVGAGIGSMFGGGNNDNDEDTQNVAQNDFDAGMGRILALRALFRSLGCLAKSDGVVSKEEADFVSGVLSSLEISNKTERETMIQAFNEGKLFTGSYDFVLGEVKRCYQPEAFASIMETYCGLVLADGRIDDKERTFLATAERIFGLPDFSRQFFARYEYNSSGSSYSYNNDSSSRQRSSSAGSRSRASNNLDADYALLGITSSATNSEVKAAYRRKIVEFHPDKIQGKGLNDAFVAFATEQTNKINTAYERICQARGMK